MKSIHSILQKKLGALGPTRYREMLSPPLFDFNNNIFYLPRNEWIAHRSAAKLNNKKTYFFIP